MSNEITLTTEEKARIFVMYLGCEVEKRTGYMQPYEWAKVYSLAISIDGAVVRYKTSQISGSSCGAGALDNCRMILKPLSEISDEDAIEVGRLSLRYDRDAAWIDDLDVTVVRKVEDSRICVNLGGALTTIHHNGHIELANSLMPSVFMPTLNYIEIVDFLRSCSYALPYKGQSLFDLGIAITSKTTTNE